MALLMFLYLPMMRRPKKREICVTLLQSGHRLHRVLSVSQGGSSDFDYLKAAAMHPDGSSSVLAGFTFGNWSTESSGNTDFMAVNLDADGSVLWEWQVGEKLA